MHRADTGGDTAAEQTDFIQRGLRIHFRQWISAHTVYSLKVLVPM